MSRCCHLIKCNNTTHNNPHSRHPPLPIHMQVMHRHIFQVVQRRLIQVLQRCLLLESHLPSG
eukprot:jgi/Mesvir1/11213/Mv26133-RA.1